MNSALLIIFAAVVMYRTIGLISTLDIHKYDGHPWRFIALASHCALIGAGSVAVAVESPAGGPMLLAGIALMVISDRRRAERRGQNDYANHAG